MATSQSDIEMVVDKGVVRSQVPIGGNTLQALGKNWPDGLFARAEYAVQVGGQVRRVRGNSSDTLVLQSAWSTAIAEGEEFVVIPLAGSPDSRIGGLAYYGVVTGVPGPNQFAVAALAGLGADKFIPGATAYSAYVLSDAGGLGAAPQGEQQAVMAYDSATGAFTTGAFTAAVAIGDEVLILHPALALLLQPPESNGILLADGTEQDVYLNDAPPTAVLSVDVWIDLANMAIGDTTTLALKKRYSSSGGWVVVDSVPYSGVAGGLLNGVTGILVAVPKNHWGVRVTLQQTAGVNRNYQWEVL